VEEAIRTTLKNPAFIERGQLQQFDIVLANPPYEGDRAGGHFL
jgi:type I restriction-modification system DNA methylase subunit